MNFELYPLAMVSGNFPATFLKTFPALPSAASSEGSETLGSDRYSSFASSPLDTPAPPNPGTNGRQRSYLRNIGIFNCFFLVAQMDLGLDFKDIRGIQGNTNPEIKSGIVSYFFIELECSSYSNCSELQSPNFF